ncbi:HK97-gp10 family putative phage morphogenesis protein [Staphylococcus aureus]|uniref:HK97-gp10 family putative phage morphogenesis protein n=1 Tax=Staphylococcus aureus TaxID=1280 RepID=UPI0027421592|nr:HK97-gp10 family putative phage morphogenesis protein [Staphylococcus aureus]WLT20412.1 HK97 gp10 family phage protein [Staphylococcus aureus]
MNMDGLDALLNQFHDMKTNIDDDVDDILQENAKEYVVRAKLKAREVMNKGYWTGNLSRNIRYKKTGDLQYTITSHAAYSGFLEFGTRYMEAEPFMWPVYEVIRKSTVEELKALFE